VTTARQKLDAPLRARVRLFGDVLGRVLRSQEPPQVLEAVEALRRGYTALREEDDPALRARLQKLIAELPPAVLTRVVRAFAVFFSLLNIAEEAHQHHCRRQQVRSGKRLWKGSFDATLRELRAQGIQPAQLQRLLGQLQYIPVFTAHPTEARRRAVMNALRRVLNIGERLNKPRRGREEREELLRALEANVQILWKTDEVRTQRPAVRDEVRTGLYYFRESLFEAVPRMYRNLERALSRVYGKAGTAVAVPSFLRFGSWIGGDRDGNPNVSAEVTEQALLLHVREILSAYIERVRALGELLTLSESLCAPSPALRAALASSATRCGLTADEPAALRREPYRHLLHLMRLRLRATRSGLDAGPGLAPPPAAYAHAQEFLHDLHLIRDSLISHGDSTIARADLQDLIRLAETFGFHLARLDMRQESARHTVAVAAILKQARPGLDYLALDEAARLQWLDAALAAPEAPAVNEAALPDEAREVLAVFHSMRRLSARLGVEVLGEYVISMTHQASHVLEVMYLGSLAGLARREAGQWRCDLRISPLFETIDDLAHIEAVLNRLLSQPGYAALLRASGGVQEVMVGYSDSCKDGGILSSAWSLHEAQKQIIAITREHGVRCRIFHGRGGTMARGGGPTHETLLAYPPGTVQGQIKFTEQGEVLYYKYNNPDTAVYELTVGATGLMKASLHLVDGLPAENRKFLGVMDSLAQDGERAYRALIDHTPGLLDYFYEATPVNEIGLMNIGSRPSHRKKDRSKTSIRAIPWVFGWAQSRHTLPAWYGIGSALERWRGKDPARLALLQRMYEDWPFFHSLLSNTQMALSKAEMDIARDYAGLCAERAAADGIFAQVQAEYARTLSQVLQIAGHRSLMADTPEVALSLQRRNPYLDPLNAIQVVLLRRYRDTALPEEIRTAWLDPLLRSINAIAAGMRNTG
jgi:phosphoenolpyruvate carboxylase